VSTVDTAETPSYSYFSTPAVAPTAEPVLAQAVSVEVPNQAPTEADVVPAAAADPQPEAQAPREKRSRDRFGRDRRERSGGRSRHDETGAKSDATPQAENPAAVPADVTSPAATSTPSTANAGGVRATMPKVQAYTLPTDALQAVAQSAGLEWIASDAERVAQAQAAIAATPAPVHVPRERKALAVVDEGPLVLVETRKDLAAVKLPFDTAAER